MLETDFIFDQVQPLILRYIGGGLPPGVMGRSQGKKVTLWLGWTRSPESAKSKWEDEATGWREVSRQLGDQPVCWAGETRLAENGGWQQESLAGELWRTE